MFTIMASPVRRTKRPVSCTGTSGSWDFSMDGKAPSIIFAGASGIGLRVNAKAIEFEDAISKCSSNDEQRGIVRALTVHAIKGPARLSR